ncbi:exodeoxyribonuclease V gamma chain [Halorhodospira halochloris]|uniref:RecBCD enzyme subunit RecC n=1 Tax=Halorhodospira halochloris TaxID=1052 RepID=A0A0X8X7H3_HALHR|nr:exodeoxyribonuclease V subunit gamma [Halorhodospira halochloris]MBK1652292.1 exodeoxyribonuclease V subunit gamma [Halorhodospira halochloris]BAU56911.1 exodeoxyribonuclease V gamma chain [Halorhodospira halochloris]
MIVHGNRMEDLRELTVEWMRRHPLDPLENETVLVQSNGIAQWLRLALARDPDAAEPGCGIAAALDMQLPARFLWQAYRAVLGPAEVPRTSPFDKEPLIWRLMRLLPERSEQPVFAPLANFLANDPDRRKRYQLAAQLADLFDQYQVYRADWLEDWAHGDDKLRRVGGDSERLAPEQRWQAELWRALLDDIGTDEARHSRAAVHTRFMQAVATQEHRPTGLPRRIIVFGISSLPHQALEALAGLARHCQILLCVHNPCEFYWADIIQGRDLLRAEHRRQAHRADMPETTEPAELHAHAHPLLAAWGKQGRDYIRLLDEYDQPDSYRDLLEKLPWQRIDLFASPLPADDRPASLLQQLQDDIRALRPAAESREHWPPVAADDDSLRFHVAYSPQREVEILHDQLLARFDADPSLRPRDIIVMVPDVDLYAPHVRAVFGQLSEDDDRHIPFTISDQGPRGQDPLLVALETLLHLPQARITVSELLDLLDTPALRRRFGLDAGDLPRLHQWVAEAGIRWGLDGEQRAALDLPAFEENTWAFGLRRLLLGYAAGAGGTWRDIEPHGDIAGLDAALVGPLAQLLERLRHWWHELSSEAAPADWGARLRGLLDDLFLAEDEAELQTLNRLLSELESWEVHCAAAGLEDPLPLTVVRESWLAALDDGGLAQRFLAGAVNFCTLMPMRAIPFRVVCLLGMDDDAYPRSPTPTDFDLMAHDYRPGDRSRREDDRYLFLEALLSARDQLYISWNGLDIRDNSQRPPSVLVGQLRDHLAAAWRPDCDAYEPSALLKQLTVHHPLQPFSPANFPVDGQGPLFSYAHEWQAALIDKKDIGGDNASPLPALEREAPLSPTELAAFLKNPVQAFCQQRLGIYFDDSDEGSEDTEPLTLAGLEAWQARETLARGVLPLAEHPDGDAEAALEAGLARLRRSGTLPPRALGGIHADELRDEVMALYQTWAAWAHAFPLRDPQHLDGPLELVFEHNGLRLEGWLADCREGDGSPLRLTHQVSRFGLNQAPYRRFDRLAEAWVEHLLACAGGQGLCTVVVTSDHSVQLAPLPTDQAREHLGQLLAAWQRGQNQALPVTCQTACTWLDAQRRAEQAEAKGKRPPDPDKEVCKYYDGNDWQAGEAGRNPYLQRLYPDSQLLLEDGSFQAWAEALYRPLFEAIEEVEAPTTSAEETA